MTGIAALQGELVAKRLELLHEMVPKASVVALLVNQNNRYTETETRVLQEGAHSLGLVLYVVRASTPARLIELSEPLPTCDPARFSSALTFSP